MESVKNELTEKTPRRFFHNFSPDKTSFAILVLIFFTLLFTYPTIVQLSTHLMGGTADGWQFPWNNYIFRDRVLQWRDPYYTDQVFYPVGVSLALHGYTEFNNVIGLLLSPFFNDVAITNLMVLLATFLSGFGVYLLTRELTGNSIAALFAGLAFAFCPFRMIRITGHIHMALTQFLPFAIWAMLKMGKTQKVRYAILTGLFFALACYCNYYYVIYLLIAFLLMVIYGFIRYKEWRTLTFVRNLILAGVIAVVLLSPVAYHTYLLLKSPTGSSFSAEEGFYTKNAAEIMDYLRVAPLNRLVLKFLGNNPIISPYSRATPGWTVLMLFIPGLIFVFLKRPSKFGILLFLGFIFFLLSLGPFLSLTENYQLPLPFQLISGIPILSHARIPDRFAIMVNLVMTIVAGYGLSLIAAKVSNSGRKAIYIGVFSLLLFELATIPFPMEAFDPPKVFYQLAQRKGDGMLSLPFYPGNIRAKLYMRFQSIHRQKLLDGRVSRNPWMPIDYIKDLSIAKSFRTMTRGDALKAEDVELDRQFAPLFRKFFNLRSIAIYPPFSYKEDIRKYVGTVFTDAKLLSDEKGIFVYELPETQADSFQYGKEDFGIRFFLLENWQFDRRSQQIVCRKNYAKILIPAIEGNNLVLKLFIKAKDAESNVNFQIGNAFITKLPLKRKISPLKLEISADNLQNEGQILQLNLDTNTTMEIHGLQLKVVPK